MRPLRVENGASEGPNGAPERPKWSPGGPKWSPMAQDGGQQGAKCHPKGLRESLESLGARQLSPKMRPRSPGLARAQFRRPLLGPKGRPKGVEIGPKSGPKVVQKTRWFQITFWDRFFSIWGCDKHRFWDLKKDPSTSKGCKAHS